MIISRIACRATKEFAALCRAHVDGWIRTAPPALPFVCFAAGSTPVPLPVAESVELLHTWSMLFIKPSNLRT